MADLPGELFDVVNEHNEILRQEKRAFVHKQGLLHRAVYVWLFDTAFRLLIQRRSPQKLIGPGQWDISVAEHLQPGESYLSAATRGVREELGLALDAADVQGPLAPWHRRELHMPQKGVHDVELVQSFRVDGCTKPLKLDPTEVSDAKFVTLADLRKDVLRHPNDFTQWFREEIEALGWFDAPAPSTHCQDASCAAR